MTFISHPDIRYEAWINNQYGQRLGLLDTLIDFERIKVVNSVNVGQITLPGTFNQELLKPDYMIELWRAPAKGTMQLEFVFFIRNLIYKEDNSGNDIIVISGPDGNDLLARRIVAYYAGTSQASKTDNADDMMKEIVDENLAGSATDSDRDISGYHPAARKSSRLWI